LGYTALNTNTTASESTAVGYQALYNSNSSSNTAVGFQANYNNSGGGNANTSIGWKALFTNNGGGSQVAVGYECLLLNTDGNQNTAVGAFALRGNTTGNSNSALGYGTTSADFSASIILGRAATATASNQFVAGSVAYPAGAVNVAPTPQTRTWDVIINGVAQKILLA
jgi:hypothetical protein